MTLRDGERRKRCSTRGNRYEDMPVRTAEDVAIPF